MESPVIDSMVEINHKEAYSDLKMLPTVNGSPNGSVKVNDENVCGSPQMKDSISADLSEERSGEENENSNSKCFIEAPVPKVNPWTVNRNAAQFIGGGVTVKPNSRNQHGK